MTHPAFEKLEKNFNQTKNLEMKTLFQEDKNRFEKFHLELDDMLVDFSKNRITDETFSCLIELAKEKKLERAIKAMFSGEKINTTEQRAVLHTALRNLSKKPIFVEDVDVMPEINRVREKMHHFSDSVRNGTFKGYTGKPFTDVVNIGIGGSDLGPVMVVKALKKYKPAHLNFHFISNVDSTDMVETLKDLSPETTLFLVASKTFTTQETMMNATSAKKWLLAAFNGDEKAISSHFVALSTNKEAVVKFGIDAENMFEFWDFVGGRYSLWSAIGLSIMIAIGYENFMDFLKGAYEMDIHFQNAPFEKNIPVILGLLSYFYITFYKAETTAVLPYDQYLERLPAYLQQASMESNGKSITKEGKKVTSPTGAILFGEPGTNGQHSFYQLIHQGTHLIPCDFIASIFSQNELENHQNVLLSNFLAQTEALMKGKTLAEVQEEGTPAHQLQHRVFDGNRPTNSILFDKMTPHALGRLIALYEHKIFVEGVLFNVDSYDQWGVELGKQLAKNILPEIEDKEKPLAHDASTNALIERVRTRRG
ncbi:MAG: glucose-6-phosphate isomerase [Alphaproteobacteria bacterium]|nr:glucose-6-phosphate isomerase [Alphaproteobacteria bacterium]